MTPTKTEQKAIDALERLARNWPQTLWIFSASGLLNVMRRGRDGERVYLSTEGVDPAYSLTTVDIPNDGGDW